MKNQDHRRSMDRVFALTNEKIGTSGRLTLKKGAQGKNQATRSRPPAAQDPHPAGALMR